MKTLKRLLTIAAVFTAMQVSAQTDKETTTRLVNAKTLKFNATSAQPLAVGDLNAVLMRMPGGMGGGSSIQLTGATYDLKISKDSVEAYLPYFGRAYTATMNPNDSGVKFKSKDFSYKSEQKKKGNWVITIKPKDNKDGHQMVLHVGVNGYAFLNVTSNNKQSISYMGYISDPAEEKK